MEIKNITKSYGKKQVLKDISFTVPEDKGICIGILGGNGSGKSTLLNILAGIRKADSGSFTFDGKNLLSDTKARTSLTGYVPQSTPLLEELTAADNLRLWYTKDEIVRECNGGVLEMLGVNGFLKTTVSKMSGGMKKRLAIGCSVAHKPRILFLDEPSAALDLVCKESICDYLRDFRKRGGIIIIATHDIQEIPLCDVLYILRDGTLHEYEYDNNPAKLIEELKK